MLGVMIVPTGIGCEIGGHAGDANPACKLIAACCDKLITHPNVVNGSYANEMPDNVLYVEGSMLDRFLTGNIGLREVNRNKILVVVNEITPEIINMVNAAKVTIGIEAEIVELDTKLEMIANIEDGKAGGIVKGWEELIQQCLFYRYNALAIYTEIIVPREISLNYYKNGGVNPWGGVEAIASKLIANGVDKPVAHAPLEATSPDDKELYFVHEDRVVDPRIAPEAVSICYLQCVLKGLNKAPQIGRRIDCGDVDFMITPIDCWGPPHEACAPSTLIIAVKENAPSYKTILPDYASTDTVVVDNYLEAAGYIMSMKAGIHPSTVRRPLNEV